MIRNGIGSLSVPKHVNLRDYVLTSDTPFWIFDSRLTHYNHAIYFITPVPKQIRFRKRKDWDGKTYLIIPQVAQS